MAHREHGILLNNANTDQDRIWWTIRHTGRVDRRDRRGHDNVRRYTVSRSRDRLALQRH